LESENPEAEAPKCSEDDAHPVHHLKR